jgi:hypothetical protein
MNCTAQPILKVSVDNRVTFLCSECMSEHVNGKVQVLESNIVGMTCQCQEC